MLEVDTETETITISLVTTDATAIYWEVINGYYYSEKLESNMLEKQFHHVSLYLPTEQQSSSDSDRCVWQIRTFQKKCVLI